MADTSGLNSINISEHISPEATGDNIGAKRVANYVWDSVNSVWIRQTSGGGGTSADVNVADIGGSPITLGNTTMSASLPVTVASDQTAITIDSENNTFKDDFTGSSVNAGNWTVSQAGGTSTTYSVASSVLTMNAQTAANDWIALTSVQTFTVPFRVQVIMKASQAIANNNFYIEVVNASGAGATALAATGVTTGTTQTAYLLTGTTATTGTIVAQNQGVKSTADTTATIATMTSYATFEQECRAEVVDFATRTVDTSSGTTANTQMRSRTILDPGEQYYVQLRSINGGSVPATNTVYSIEAVIVQDATKTVVEISGGRGNASADKGIPIASLPTLSTVSTLTNGNSGFPGSIADVASAAITSTANSTAVTPTYGTSYKYNIPVTAVAGTLPTLDLEIQESRDAGTNYQTIYQFPQITATGSYDSPTFIALGNRYRLAQTITGSAGQSFTRAINRTQLSSDGSFMRQIVDNVARSTINLNSTNSTSASLYAEMNTNNVQLTVDLGTVVVAPVLQIQASDDVRGSWYNVGATLTAVASSTVSLTVNNVTAQFFRVLVQTGGTTANKNYVLLRAF